MSIIDSFDNKSAPILDINNFCSEPKHYSDVCIVTFSKHVKDEFIKKYNSKIIGESSTANGPIEIYLFEVENKKILFYMSPIGSSLAGTIMHEVSYISGATKFIVF